MTEAIDTSPKLDESYGHIVGHLIEQGYLSMEQVEYAARIQTKLVTPKTLLDIFKELKYLDDKTIKKLFASQKISLRLGDLLVELGYLSKQKLASVIEIQQQEGLNKNKIGKILTEKNFITEEKLIEILSLQMGYAVEDLNAATVDHSLFTRIPIHLYDEYSFIPLRKQDDDVVVAFSDPLNQYERFMAEKYFGKGIVTVIARESSIAETARQVKRTITGKYSTKISEDTAVGIVNGIIMAARESNTSDIHIAPLKDKLQVRFRIDGVLTLHREYPLDLAPLITSRLKILCNVDIAEKRRHQGGRIDFDTPSGPIDIRASFYVTITGEKIVLRLLKRQGELLALEDLGMARGILSRFKEEALYMPSGVILITGPTGSGKTSTVYSCIAHINSPEVAIITAEEPVEYMIDGIAQCSIDPKINLTFEETLRHMVRQDPDVIVIGEIRDVFSADIAVQAALTGHKVLTTFHTEDSIGALIRLLNMKIDAFLVSSTVAGIVAQRLLRRICSNCAEPYNPTPLDMQRLGCDVRDIHSAEFKKGRGCGLCNLTGYKGRLGVYELLVPDERVRNAVLGHSTSYELRKISIESTDLVTLLEDGLVKAAGGHTTIDEVIRCLPRLNRPRPLPELYRMLGM